MALKQKDSRFCSWPGSSICSLPGARFTSVAPRVASWCHVHGGHVSTRTRAQRGIIWATDPSTVLFSKQVESLDSLVSDPGWALCPDPEGPPRVFFPARTPFPPRDPAWWCSPKNFLSFSVSSFLLPNLPFYNAKIAEEFRSSRGEGVSVVPVLDSRSNHAHVKRKPPRVSRDLCWAFQTSAQEPELGSIFQKNPLASALEEIAVKVENSLIKYLPAFISHEF